MPVPDARAELISLLETLVKLARDEGSRDQEAFFDSVRAGVERAREVDDLADPFMLLSTAAFRGYAFSAPVQVLLDRVLAQAQTVAHALSAPTRNPV